ncbi:MULTISPECIES: FimV/HubP family polar landmark protein [unclassified Pseudoxanthomonas]|uniref:FimV/HubP family polar landmark protein n=1 Tax=unclassified Pseudoxanthomonas TaxID=2645906 RepID=UPI0008E7F77E|nr:MULTISPECIES: FimV/HubP family polar landmark protein [unclassified Pseudoxanthomonas]PPJ43790.1 ferrous iron transporter B [Pseudoxanthomonas sp. KAs_5_3]SFV36273.1 pilus assembly protein FimV [Pseudoxanthomonas sp. YR558]
MIGLGLALLSNVALALGLGEIKVKSQPGQPLLAEIPIISSEPGELEQLRARLASPTTFERVGLPRPQGLVNELDFSVALDEAGRPVVRVTSRTPVDVPAVNFLIEVDWGQGRLVREYSALVSTPGTLAAAEQPVIDAPVAAPADTITRPVEPVVAATPEPAPAEQVPTPAPTRPAPSPAPVVAATPAPQVAPGDALAPVRRGQSLSQVAAPVARAQGYTLDQAMVALLRANPEAFINGNINLLKQGAVLRVPESAEAQTILEDEAAALVRSQIAEWRRARAPIPQPAAVVEPAPTAATPSAPRTAPVADARLEIAPAAAGASGSGTQSGVSAGGEGEMLANEQLQQSKEDLAARDAEVQELRTQVAELEKLKTQQEQLLAMKDSDLAAAQQRLAQASGSDGGVPVWAWAGFGLLLVGSLAWGFAQRRRRLAPVARSTVLGDAPSPSRAAELAAVMPAPAAEPVATEPTPVLEPVIVPAAAPAKPVPKPAPAPAPVKASGPTWHSGGSPATTQAPAAAPAGRDRLELAVAYLDLGDVATARDLLNEVAAGADAGARDEALQLLREIG